MSCNHLLSQHSANNTEASPTSEIKYRITGVGGVNGYPGVTTGMRCITCMYFVAKARPQGEIVVGRCRRHAPTMKGFPVVFATDWCGDHKLDEGAI